MLTLAGYQLGTLFQGGTFAAAAAMLAIILRVWILGIPERLRAANEGKVAAAAELSDRFKAWRAEVHDLKEELMKVAGKQKLCDQALAEAHALNRWSKDQNKTMLFIIKLLISELKRLDPKSIIVKQAEDTLAHMAGESDPSKSNVLNAVEHSAEVAQVAVEEVKFSEGGGK